MPSLVSLALAGPRLVLRAADDLHRLADAAERLPEIEQTVIAVQRDMVRAADRLDKRLIELLAVADGLQSLEDIAPSVDTLTEAARTLAATAQPLRGASERLGRLADRLPGAPPR